MSEEGKDRFRAESSMGFTVSAFPIELWKEWDSDCKAKYGDCRWIKIWNDHKTAKDAEQYRALEVKLVLLEKEIEELKGKKKDAEPVKTFTQELKGGD